MRIGDLCYIQPPESSARLPVEVVGFRRDRILLMPWLVSMASRRTACLSRLSRRFK
jgi:flagellar biosynthesis/type III secretory pathway ATPase